MKSSMRLMVVIFIATLPGIFVNAQTGGQQADNSIEVGRKISIDLLDTVIFDMSQSVVIGNSILFPVYIHSDEVINALDFSFKYNQSNLLFDSIANLTNYIEPYSYYNAIDSTVRFTSNSLQSYAIDSPLVAIQFTMLHGVLLASDMNTVSAYLNGDPCSIIIIDPLPMSTSSVQRIEPGRIYPNPAQDFILIEANENDFISLFDTEGRLVHSTQFTEKKNKIDVSELLEGIYFFQINNEQLRSTGRFLICR